VTYFAIVLQQTGERAKPTVDILSSLKIGEKLRDRPEPPVRSTVLSDHFNNGSVELSNDDCCRSR